MLLHTNDQYLGRKLKRDLFNLSGVLVASAMTLLQINQIRLLDMHSIILSEEDITSESSENRSRDVDKHALIEESVSQISEVFHEMRYSKKIPLMDIRRTIVPLIHETTEQPNLFALFATLQSKDDYTYRHNIGVGVISTLIGRWLGMDENELSQLTMAATLHDVGKIKIPLDILNKPGKLTSEEYDLMKKHTIFGYQLIKETVGATHRQALVALQHHEREDSSGYPFAVHSNKIDPHSRIVAVADVFHAMTSNRPYRDASPFYETLKQMHHNAFGEFDAHIIKLFLDKMMSSLIGNVVLLTDGRQGSIIMINHHAPLYPLVLFEDQSFLDLSKEADIHIASVIA